MMGSMFRSAIFKLTVVYVAIVMAISLTFSATVYRLAVDELETGFQNQYIRWLTEYRPYGLRQPGDPAAELAARANRIYIQLVYLNIMVFGATTIASYWLARRTLRPIERAHEQQKRFTADVSHELRTPLTALKMDTEVTLFDKTASTRKLRQTLEGNLEETRRMEHLVNNLLQLTSLEANQLRTEFTRVNICDVAADGVGVMKKFADARQIIFKTDLRDGFVAGDSSSLTQLCVILLENAIKYSPKKSVVTISTMSKAQTVTFTVEDTGRGIASKDLPHVFDRFYRADRSRNEQQPGGYGLGLSLAKLIADLHNGDIVITSAPGKGTRVLVRLPSAPKK